MRRSHIKLSRGMCFEKFHFSTLDEVGFVRDLIIDVLARNLHKLLDYQENQLSNLCEDLGEYRII